MFQIYLFHFPFSCQQFRLEVKCLILLRHLHFFPSTSSVLISASVTVSELSVKKVRGVFREKTKTKQLQFYPESLWKAAARICSEVPECGSAQQKILWQIWLQCGCCKPHERCESSHAGLLNTRSSFRGGKILPWTPGHWGSLAGAGALRSLGLVLLKPRVTPFSSWNFRFEYSCGKKNQSSVWDWVLCTVWRVGAFVVKFRDSKCKFWCGSGKLQNPPSCAGLAALLPDISIRIVWNRIWAWLQNNQGFSWRRCRQPVPSVGFRHCISLGFLGNPKFCRDIIIPALLAMSNPLPSTEIRFSIKARPWSWFSGSFLPSWGTLVMTGYTGLGSVFLSSWRSGTGDKLYQSH